MFDYTHYVPVLRWKRAERCALCELFKHETDTGQMTPLIEIVPEAFAPRSSGKIVPVDDVLIKTADGLLNYWGLDRFFVDLWLLPSTLRPASGQHLLEALGEHARCRQMLLVPVTGLDRSRNSGYQSAVSSLASMDDLGACVRLQVSDIRHSSFRDNLDRLLDSLNLSPREVDLVIDHQIVEGPGPDFASLCASIPHLHHWRTFTSIGGSFPQDLTGFTVGTHRIDRLDWLTWRDQVASASALPREAELRGLYDTASDIPETHIISQP